MVTGAALIMQSGWKPYFTHTHYQQQVADAHFADTGTDLAQQQYLLCHMQNHGNVALKREIQTIFIFQNHKRKRFTH